MLRAPSAVELITPAELAAELNVTPETLRRWRKAGTGPDWIRVGDRFVRYPREGVQEWLRRASAS